MVDRMVAASALRRQESVLVRTMPCHVRSRRPFTRTCGCFCRTFPEGDRSPGSRIPYLDSQVRRRNTSGYIGGSWLCHLPPAPLWAILPPARQAPSIRGLSGRCYVSATTAERGCSGIWLGLGSTATPTVQPHRPHRPAHARRWRTNSALPVSPRRQELAVCGGGYGTGNEHEGELDGPPHEREVSPKAIRKAWSRSRSVRN